MNKKLITIGLLREGKNPPDKRVAFTPQQAIEIQQLFPTVKIVCQESAARCFSDQEYRSVGIEVAADISHCDILMGIKEVPIPQLIAEKFYLFFSHTIKKQIHNKSLLQTILAKKIHLIDYEAFKDYQGNRLVAFGRYAGLVGAHNGLWAYGQRYGGYQLRRAYSCFDINELKLNLREIKFPPFRIILTGTGRVAKGAMETLDTAGIRKVSPEDFLNRTFSEPIYVQLKSSDYNSRNEGGLFNREEFHLHPERYSSSFLRYTGVADILMAGAYWNPKASVLFTRQDMLSSAFTIKIIADITCDIGGSIPSTKKASTIPDPVYDYDAKNDQVADAFSNNDFITVMAIDNLPCELPRNSSDEFGRDLIDRILKPLLLDDPEKIISRATIAKDGKLGSQFQYLKDYVQNP